MAVQRRRGFTLIELLVVIAIIGILAAMLFPVFARARESARKIQCLANVKNIALAFQMYLTDYDRFPPSEQRLEALRFWAQQGGWDYDTDGQCGYEQFANPYIKPPVVLDEYIKNRDVWNCPSAQINPSFAINPCPGGDWLGAREAAQGIDNCPPGGCLMVFPPGWGGDITDTFTQGACSGGWIWSAGLAAQSGSNPFVWEIGTPRENRDLSLSSVGDAAKRVVCADAGIDMEFYRTARFAYPDIMGVEKSACGWCGAPDWCALAANPWDQDDAAYRKEHAHPRHLGGVNIGFADGHAKWMNSEQALFGGEDVSDWTGVKPTEVLLTGVATCGFGAPNDDAQAWMQANPE